MTKPIRLLAIIEAATITGPAKNLLQFARMAHHPENVPPVEVSIVVFQRTGQPELFLETAAQLSLPVYPIQEKGRFDRSVVEGLSALGKHLRPDLVQSHAVKSHFLVRKSGLDGVAPWVAFHHGYTWPDVRARLYNQLDRWSLRNATRVLTVSRPFREELVRKGVESNRVEIVHNAVNPLWGQLAREPQARVGLRSELGIAADRKVILIVGRLSREKDHISLVRAVSQLRDLNVHLLIVGEGPERARIEGVVSESGLRDAVTLTGQVPTAEPYYGISDIAVLSSLSEGSPNALLEAMAARVPVVATSVGGIPEIVTHRESALLIQPGDPQALSVSLRELLTNSSLAEAFSKRGYELILTRHTPESRTKRLIDIYAGIIGRT